MKKKEKERTPRALEERKGLNGRDGGGSTGDLGGKRRALLPMKGFEKGEDYTTDDLSPHHSTVQSAKKKKGVRGAGPSM